MTQGLIGWIPNGPASTVRTAINTADAALATESEGTSAPSPTQPFMLWRNNTAKLVKRRNSADNGWNIKENYGATVDPSPGDDTADGYILGSVWRNTAAKKNWICEDNATNAAKWVTIEHLSVRQFGAKGDGTTDDTAAITAAIAAMPATGCRLWFPAGTYKVSSTIELNKPGIYFGDFGATFIKTSHESNDVFLVTAEFVTIADMSWDSSVTRSGGAYVKVTTGNRFRLERFRMYHYYYGIHITSAFGATATIQSGELYYGVAGLATGIIINAGYDISICDFLIAGGTTIAQGILITAAGDVEMSRLGLLECGIGLNIFASGGAGIASVWVQNSFLDNCDRGCSIGASGSGSAVVRLLFNQVWFSSAHTDYGVCLYATSGGIVDGVDFVGCHVFLNAASGIVVTSTAVKNVNVLGGAFAQNGGAGVSFAVSGIESFSVKGIRAGASYGCTGNTYGIFVESGCTKYIITDNNLLGNTTTNLNDGGTTPKVVSDNLT